MPKFLPKTTGSYVVGCADIINKYGADRTFFRFYYPTCEQTLDNTNAATWLPESQYGCGYADFIKKKWLGHLFNWVFCGTKVQAIWNAPFQLPPDKTKLPLVVFSHGLGANRTTYSGICSDLASHGVLVAALEHADQSASATYFLEESDDGKKEVEKNWIEFVRVMGGQPEEFEIRNKQVHIRADACSDVLNQFEKINNGTSDFVQCDIDLTPLKNVIDFDKCGIMGHSFGGGTSVVAIAKDERFKVGVGLDTWMMPLDGDVYKNVRSVPILFINSEKFHWPANIASIRKLDADALNTDAERAMVTISGSVHQSQSDFPLLVQQQFIAKLFRLTGTADALEVYAADNKLAFGFIGKHLNLEFAQSVEDVIEAHKDLLYLGSNVEVDEEKIKASKEKIRSML